MKAPWSTLQRPDHRQSPSASSAADGVSRPAKAGRKHIRTLSGPKFHPTCTKRTDMCGGPSIVSSRVGRCTFTNAKVTPKHPRRGPSGAITSPTLPVTPAALGTVPLAPLTCRPPTQPPLLSPLRTHPTTTTWHNRRSPSRRFDRRATVPGRSASWSAPLELFGPPRPSTVPIPLSWCRRMTHANA